MKRKKVTPDRAKQVFDAIAAAFGRQPAPVVPTTPSEPILADLPKTGTVYRPGGTGTIRNSSMYGKGRLSLFVPERSGTSLVNPGFEQGSTGWTIVSPHPGMKAQVLTTR